MDLRWLGIVAMIAEARRYLRLPFGDDYMALWWNWMDAGLTLAGHSDRRAWRARRE